MREIGFKLKRAVLIFNIPIVYLPEGDEVFGVLYGGRIRNGTQWTDSVLRPGGGIEDANARYVKSEVLSKA